MSTGGAISSTKSSGSSHTATETPAKTAATTGKADDETQPSVVESAAVAPHKTSDVESANPAATQDSTTTLGATQTVTGQTQQPAVEAAPAIAEVATATPTTTPVLETASVPVVTAEIVAPTITEPASTLSTVITDFLNGATTSATTGDTPVAPSDSPIETALLAFARKESSSTTSNTVVNPLVTAQSTVAAATTNPITSVTNSVLSLASPLLGPNGSALATPLQVLYQVPVVGPLVQAGVALLAGPLNFASQLPFVGPVIHAFAVALGLLPTYTATVNAANFTSEAQLRAWHEQLDALGLRATGSAAEAQNIDNLIGMLQAAGLNPSDITTQDVKFQQWTLNPNNPNAWKLTVTDANGAVVPVSAQAYMAYTGVTDANGIGDKQLVYVSDLSKIDPATVAGKVVVFDVPLTKIPEPAFLALQYPGKVYDPSSEILTGGTYQRPYLNDLLPTVEKLQAAGAVGVVGVLDYPDAAVTGSYLTYDGVIRNTPGLLVGRDSGAILKQQALAGATANVVMDATVQEATSRNIVAVIPGKDYGTAADQVVLIHSHTDGTNGLEDDGPYISVAMAQYLNQIPQAQRESTYAILLSTGHFAGGAGATYFANNPDTPENVNHDLYADLISKTKAAMTIEHVGALEYTEKDGQMVPTGNPEPGVWWSEDNAGLIEGGYLQLVQGGAAPGGVLFPLGEVLGDADGSPDSALWPGEGQYLQAAGINDINYITGPTYLLNYGISTTDKVDFAQVRSSAISLTDQALYYGRTSKADINDSVGLAGLGPVGVLWQTGVLKSVLGGIL